MEYKIIVVKSLALLWYYSLFYFFKISLKFSFQGFGTAEFHQHEVLTLCLFCTNGIILNLVISYFYPMDGLFNLTYPPKAIHPKLIQRDRYRIHLGQFISLKSNF